MTRVFDRIGVSLASSKMFSRDVDTLVRSTPVASSELLVPLLLRGDIGFLDGEKAPRFETRLVGVLVCRASGFVAVPAMDDLIDDIPFFLGTAAITGRRGERAFEAALARARAGEEANDGFEILVLTADAEVFSLF